MRATALIICFISIPSVVESQIVGEHPDCGEHATPWEQVLVFKTESHLPDTLQVERELGPALANGLDGLVKTLRGLPGEPDPIDLRKQFAAVWLCANAIILNEEVVLSQQMCRVGGQVQPCPPRLRQNPVAVRVTPASR